MASGRTAKWRRWPSRTTGWPAAGPTTAIAINTPSAGTSRITVSNPTNAPLELYVTAGNRAPVEPTPIPAGGTNVTRDVPHTAATERIEVRAGGYASGPLLASRNAG